MVRAHVGGSTPPPGLPLQGRAIAYEHFRVLAEIAKEAEDAEVSSLRRMICFKSREFSETAGFTPYQTALRSLLP